MNREAKQQLITVAQLAALLVGGFIIGYSFRGSDRSEAFVDGWEKSKLFCDKESVRAKPPVVGH